MNDSIYQAPKSLQIERNVIERVGKDFRIIEPGKLPSICVGCGREDNLVQVQDKLRYVDPIIFLWLLLSPLALIIAYYICRRDVHIQFERCNFCNNKKILWSKLNIISWLCFVAAIALRSQTTGTIGLIFGFSIFVFLITSFFTTAMKDSGFSVKSYEEPYFYLKGFKKSVSSKLADG